MIQSGRVLGRLLGPLLKTGLPLIKNVIRDRTLMGHEIFFKIFDGLQNTFLCSIFIILFFKLKWFKQKISKLAIKEI